MTKFLRWVNCKDTLITWIVIVIFYLFPPLFNYLDTQDEYFQNALWFFYLIPTLLISYKKGTVFGGLVSGASSLLFLLIESLQPLGVSKQEVIIFFEITIINLIASVSVGILVKRNLAKRRQLKESEERYKGLVENSFIGVFMIQDKKLVYVNPRIAAILGLTQEELLGKNIMDYVNEYNRTNLLTHFQKLIAAKEHFFQDEFQTIEHGGAARYLEIQATLTSINGSPAIIGFAIDVTDKKKAKDELVYLAYHDTLTGLPNKHYLMNEVTKQFDQMTSLGKPVYILYLNLDRFKLINDSFGHQVGDQLFRMVSKRIADIIEPIGKAVRTVGDEFIIYLPDFNEGQVLAHARSLLKGISEPNFLESQEIQITASIGIAPFGKGDSLEDVVQKASSALHNAKDFGGNQYQLFSSVIGQQASRRLQLEQRLRKALEQNHLDVVYQPKLNLYTNRISGVEALIRWNDPILGVVSPDEFIPIAEETGMIIPIGKWVLEKSCQQNGEWNKRGYPPIHVCVNISSKQFLQDDFVNMVQRVLQEAGLAPEQLNLEITERIALYNIDDTIEKLLQLKQLGVSISLDDFGTGYSSLSYLKKLPIDYLKIDRSFIDGILEDKQDFAIIDSIISLSHSLGMSVVAEGVEDELQLKTLMKLHCDEIQGYYYAKPLTAGIVSHFLDEEGDSLLERGSLVIKGGMK